MSDKENKRWIPLGGGMYKFMWDWTPEELAKFRAEMKANNRNIVAKRVKNWVKCKVRDIRIWWKLKQGNKRILKIIEQEKKRDNEYARYTTERVAMWLEKNEFGLTAAELNSHCVSAMPKSRKRNIDRDI